MSKHQSRRAVLSVENLEDRCLAAVDAFIWFESPIVLPVPSETFKIKDFSFGVENPTTIFSATGGAGAGKIKFNEFTIKKTTDIATFEIKDFSFGVENPTTIGSATGGAGAGKIKFNEFTIKKTTNMVTFEIKDFSFGVENPTTIGSATGGAGAGKIKFNEFQIKKTSDKASPAFIGIFSTGDEFQLVVIEMRQTDGDPQSGGKPFLNFKFDTVFTTKIDWSGPGDEGPEESITLVFGKLR